MQEPDITVIIPACNAERYLPACLDSLWSQQMGSACEVLCIDDGSCDATADILAKAAAAHENLRVLHQKHAGPGVARNLGIREAKGKYIAFLDSDDAWATEHALAMMVDAIKTDQLDILCFGAEVVFESKALQDHRYKESQRYRRRDSIGICPSGRELLCRMIRQDAFLGSVCLMCFRRDFLVTQDIQFPALRHCEDEVFCLKALLSAGKAGHIADQFYQRRVRQGSLTASADNFAAYLERVEATREMLDFVQEQVADTTDILLPYIARFAADVCRRFARLPETERQQMAALSPLERSYHHLLTRWSEAVCESQASYIFPYHLFRRGERVVIYGAGNVGRDFVRQLASQDYVRLVAIADKRWQTANIPRVHVLAPEQLRGIEADAILIAVQDKALSDSIRADLANLGIPEEKLRWDGSHYLRKDFYDGWYFPLLEHQNN